MKVKIAIHKRGFSYRWIDYCKEKAIPYKVVNCFENDIIANLKDVQGLLWNWSYGDLSDCMIARRLLPSVEAAGIKVFPNNKTSWYYDDKIAQKYLLEAIEAPLVPTYVFYNKKNALEWCQNTTYPKVFKLSSGAGSQNVKLLKDVSEAIKYVETAFSKGFKYSEGYFRDTRLKLKKVQQKRNYLDVILRFPHSFKKQRRRITERGREKNYIYFQDFIPNNQFDTRVTVIGNRIFGFTRNVRENDFRASGSGSVDYDLDRIDPNCLQLAYEITKKIGAQSFAFDFVSTVNKKPQILEISYTYTPEVVYRCLGHWDENMNWHQGQIWPQDAILEDLLNDIIESL